MKMTGKVHYRRRWPRIVSRILVALLFVASIIGVIAFFTRDTNPIPKQLRDELTFSPLVIPSTNKIYTTTEYRFDTAEGTVQILTYIIHTQDGVRVSVSEYTQPSEFTDIPEYKERFLTNIAKQYATVQTSNGTVYLGRMTKQHNKQLGILIERGLIVFMSPDRELNEADWRQLGDSFEIQKKTRS